MEHRFLGLGCLLAILPSVMASANQADLWDLPIEQLMTIEISSVATGSTTPVSRSASTVSVITRDQIQAMGANDLDQVLETVPGLHITRSSQAYFSKYIFRGIASFYNPEALLMINGIPVKTLFTGARNHIWAAMPVKSIQRIEVIRGPGSALYGADAFAGVINIQTRNGTDIEHQEAGVRVGSFDTWGAWVQASSELAGASLGFTLEYEDTNGQRETVQADAQTQLDGLTGTQASRAPGPVNVGHQATDLRLDLTTEHWQWRAGYQQRDNVGTSVGIAEALDPSGLYGSERINSDITYRREDLIPHWELEAQLSYYHNTQESLRDSLLFPAGVNFGTGVFADGMIGNPSYKEDQARLDLKAAFRGLDSHILRLGTGYFWGDIYKVTETKNFSGFPPTPLPEGLVDVSDTDAVFLPEEQRTAHYLYLQDEWELTPHTVLSSGLRFDYYSDFGDHLTPRIALVHAWNAAVSTRLSYGEAFHAPSFVDLYSISNPVALGNPNLEPETIDTWEASLHHQLHPTFHYSLTGFTYRIKDSIVYLDSMAQNAGSRKGHGGELEASWQPLTSLRIAANYSYQKSIDQLTNANAGEAPNHEAYLRTEWSPASQWLWTTELLWVGKQPRAASDPRPDLQDYTSLNLALTRRQLWQHLDLMLSARNLFDANIREPSPSPSVPNDYPQAGRSLILEASWSW